MTLNKISISLNKIGTHNKASLIINKPTLFSRFVAISDSDYVNASKDYSSKVKKEKEREKEKDVLPAGSKRRGTVSTPPPVAVSKPASKAASSKLSLKTGPTKTNTPVVTPAKVPIKKPKEAKDEKEKVPVVIKKEEDELKGLEELYYGISDGTEEFYEHFPYSSPRANPAELTRTVECPICLNGETYDSNEKLQTHLVSHISPEGKQHQFQCLFCLEKHATESVLAKHNQIMHPTETKTDGSPSYHCLICQQRHNSLHLLTAHLQKVHSTLELPYWCQSCGYRSSSHRDLVRHFYDDHKNQNFLQCPYCLDVSKIFILLNLLIKRNELFADLLLHSQRQGQSTAG